MFAEIDGTRVYYETAGQEGPKVVLLHGWGCSTELMRPIAAGLQADHQVLLLDFPGHGQSGKPPKPWGVPDFAACLRALLEETGFVPCSVVAHSFGGRVAAWLAASDQNPFDRIVLTGAAGLKAPPTEEGSLRQQQYRKKKEWVQRLRGLPGMAPLAGRLQERLIQKYGSADYKALDADMRPTFNLVIQQDLRDCYARIRSSTLLIWGAKDTETPLWMGREMESMIPDAGLVVFENGSHFAYLEEAQRFLTIVRSFL